MAATKDINISIFNKEEGHIKFLKIVPYKTGGFAIILPRLTTISTGRLEKTYVNYENYGTKLHVQRDESEQFGVNDIVKFSYHKDGFVQFSSTTNNRIKSGRDSSGQPKGLGILSWPLSNPVSTGPSMTISFYGLSGFKKATQSWVDKAYAFETEKAAPHPKANFVYDVGVAYAMAFYIVPNSVKGEIVDVDGRKFAHLAMMQGLPNGQAFMRLRELVRVIEIPNQNFRILVSWFKIPNKFQSESGYMFFSPTDGKRGLTASYPAGDGLGIMRDISFD